MRHAIRILLTILPALAIWSCATLTPAHVDQGARAVVLALEVYSILTGAPWEHSGEVRAALERVNQEFE